MKIFLTDGTLKGFYTAVFCAYKYTDCIITSDVKIQLSFDSDIINVVPDQEKYERVVNKIKLIDELAEDEIFLVLRSADTLKEQVAFEYIKLLLKENRPVRGMFANPHVLEMVEICKRVSMEIHHLHGFLRFMETEKGILYAPYSPDNDITDLICRHFIKRLKSERFVIHDVKRKKAAIYDGKNCMLANVNEAEVYLSQYEKVFETLWKKYYQSVNVKERPHEKQMKGYMPVRYWKFMPEKKD